MAVPATTTVLDTTVSETAVSETTVSETVVETTTTKTTQPFFKTTPKLLAYIWMTYRQTLPKPEPTVEARVIITEPSESFVSQMPKPKSQSLHFLEPLHPEYLSYQGDEPTNQTGKNFANVDVYDAELNELEHHLDSRIYARTVVILAMAR